MLCGLEELVGDSPSDIWDVGGIDKISNKTKDKDDAKELF